MSTQAASMHFNFNRGTVLRFGAYLGLWIILTEFSVTNFAVGLLTAAWATWISVRLLPVSNSQFSPTALMRFAMRLPWQSLVAGADVARRALDPRMPLQPGFITYDTRLESGPGRDAFLALMSLQPGTLPVGIGDSNALLIHCLDTSQPVAANLAAEEALYAQITGGGRRRPIRND
jgi:multicomponent Na+:H+ antiporter subunit E